MVDSANFSVKRTAYGSRLRLALDKTMVSKRLGIGLLSVGAIGVAIGLFGLLDTAVGGHGWQGRVFVSFMCLGLLLGAAFVFDKESGSKRADRPVVRVAIGVASGCAFGVLWNLGAEGVALSILVGAILGYLGMAWAKYCTF